jgi:hypothetical protein
MSNQLNLLNPNLGLPEFLPSVIRNVMEHLQSYTSANSRLVGGKIVFHDKNGAEIPAYTWESQLHDMRELDLPTDNRQRLVASIDSSCITVGDTEDGIVYACKTAVVFARDGRVMTFVKSGPLVFYVDGHEDSHLFGSKNGMLLAAHNSRVGESLIREHIEKVLRFELARSLSNSVIVVDGSFQEYRASHEYSLGDLSRVAKIKGNSVLGMSKASRLKFLTPLASGLSSLPKRSVAVETTSTLKILFPNFVGKSFLVKFTEDPNVFRCDCMDVELDNALLVLSDISHNDSFFRGYPESLRLAHHLSIFSRTDVSALRSYLCKAYSVQRLLADDVRRSILGRIWG